MSNIRENATLLYVREDLINQAKQHNIKMNGKTLYEIFNSLPTSVQTTLTNQIIRKTKYASHAIQTLSMIPGGTPRKIVNL
jgi:hypothetical protein